MRRLALRSTTILVPALCAVLCAAFSRSVIVWWAMRLARSGPRHVCRFAVTALARSGEEGVAPLLLLATDLRPLPVAGGGEYADLVPPDAVCDLALDALRGLRSRGPAPRTFEWNASAELPTYERALAEYRLRELDLALTWWARRRATVCRRE